MISNPRGTKGRAKRATLATLLLTTLFLARSDVITPMARSASAAPEPPSIVFILADDQRYDTLAHMPRVQSLLADEGVTFDRSFVSVPLCCPSRTTSLTGLYSHNTGVYDNQRPTGGFHLFEDDSTIATWLHPQYSTALFGKYLNEYNRASYVPPGWDRWVALMDLGDGTQYYDYSLSVDGREQEHGSAPSEYQTTLITRRAVSFIRDTQGPLFLWFAPSAPHPPAIPAPKDKGTFTGWIPDRLPDFNEEDVSDKNVWTQMLPLLTDTSKLDSLARRQMRTLLGIDRAVGRLVDALEETGRLENTMIVYTSDNGMAWGEHRWFGKNAPWEEAMRVPMVVRFDPAVTAPGSTDHHLIVNTDNAPSMADAAGVVAPTTDGTSFLPLLSGAPISWRTSFLLEHMYRYHGRTSLSDFPSYCGIRTEDAKYLEYSGGEHELYDLASDPYEMENVADDPGYAALRSSLDAELAGMCPQIPVEP